MTLTYKEVAEIVKIIDSGQCEEVCLELEGAKILVRRKGASAPAPIQVSTTAPSPDGGLASATPNSNREQPEKALTSEDSDQICAPMVGTFYTRPAPDEPEFVTIGSKVAPGTPVCIIEVMKLFTTIEARQEGTIKAILAADGEMVEYGQPLFVLG